MLCIIAKSIEKTDEDHAVSRTPEPLQDDSTLREKAILLLKRERELLALRMVHDRTTAWLGVAQSLPGHFDLKVPVRQIYAGVVRSLVAALKYQKAMFFEILPGAIHPLGVEGKPDRPMAVDVADFLQATPHGYCNEPEQAGLAKLAELLNLHRFMWSRGDLPNASLLIVAGFDRERADFYSPLEEQDLAQFRNMSQQFWVLLRNMLLMMEVQESNKKLAAWNASLEQKIEERTQELTRRGRDMRLVLDNVEQGFLTIDTQGRLAQERSASIDRWFGPYEEGCTFVQYMSGVDLLFAQMFELGHEALNEGAMPSELCLVQLPKRIRFKGREFRCSYRELRCAGDGGAEDAHDNGLLIVITDVTDQLASAQNEAEQREVMALFQGLMLDRRNCLAFFSEASPMMDRLRRPDTDLLTVKGLLHTLKGNAGVVNLHVLSGLCHAAEDAVAESGALPHENMSALDRHWQTLNQMVRKVLGERAAHVLELDGRDLERLRAQIKAGASMPVVLSRLRFLALDPIEHVFQRLAKHAVELASRLGKGPLDVVIEGRGIRVDAQHWAPLWTDLVHLVRNAIDHGLETAVDRHCAGKKESARLQFTASVSQQHFTIGLEDDGRGIDWSEIRRLAEAQGLPCDSEADLLNALCTPALTTRHTASEISGRGMGLAIVHGRVLQLGGTLSVDSRLGAGTTWRLCFPLPPATDEATVMVASALD
jgi:signal transduction histidine kinase